MIIVFKQNAKENEVKRVLDKVEKLGLKTHISGRRDFDRGFSRRYNTCRSKTH